MNGTIIPPIGPLSDVRKNLKVDWYRCPIDRKILVSLIRPSDLRGLAQAVGHLGAWAVLGLVAYYCFTIQAWWGFAAAVFLQGTVASFFGAPHHELCHRTVFKTQWLNEAFLYVFSILGWANFRVYRFSHNYHHRYTLFLAGDREEVMPVKPSLRALYLLQLFTFNFTGGYQSNGMIPTVRGNIELALNRFDRPFLLWGRELYEGHDKQRRKAVSWARTVLAFHATVLVIALAIGQPVIALLVSGSAFVGNWLRYFVGVPMHCGLRSNVSDFRKCARTIRLDPVSGFLFWYMNWHLEHHMYAAVPCYNLGKLHDALADDMPEPRTLFGAWKEMRDTWKRQRLEPDYAFDTPVPPPRPQVDRRRPAGVVATSLGDLATRELAE